MAQNNRLKYYISFEADTKKAKDKIDDMFKSLQQVNAPKNILSKLWDEGDIAKARKEVAQLEGMLKGALNLDTGRLDLSKLNRSLKNSNLSVRQFANSFNLLGKEGELAFRKITEAVLQGETPLKRQNMLFDKMAETMRNTVRWQISSTVLNAFTTTISDAYKYAEDLNRSLNDIRIVTGQSVEQMDVFAEKANKAARELRTTTKAYTDAALIFYQQGLEDDEVIERTNAVMKMSNVTGEAATDVSSYMTAIWNNFDNGAHTLEYYADAITKLGAETAASSEEIAGGLEKFAAVADTVGLSYEYATAALATVVSQTRQSEEIVGTAFKTIFARLSSLSLGETLEDGTTLTKYSQALADVGVNILEQNGELKEMDAILDELGAKWEGLNTAQKNALAQTVGGVRQYNQLIALLDNYDDFKLNVDLALNAEGTLTEQAKIFEESWLGAKKRVTAALEGIYDTLLEDKVFITLTNGLASVIEAVDWLIDRAGGLPAVISLSGIVIQKVFGHDIKQIFSDLSYDIQTFFGKTQRESALLIEDFAKSYDQLAADMNKGQEEYANALLKVAQQLSKILIIEKDITQEKRAQLQSQFSLLTQYSEARQILGQKKREDSASWESSVKNLRNVDQLKDSLDNYNDLTPEQIFESTGPSATKKYIGKILADNEDLSEKYSKEFNKIGDLRNKAEVKKLNELLQKTEKDEVFKDKAFNIKFGIKDSQQREILNQKYSNLKKNAQDDLKLESQIKALLSDLEKENITDEEKAQKRQELIDAEKEHNKILEERKKIYQEIKDRADDRSLSEEEDIKTSQDAIDELSEILGQGFAAALQLGSGISACWAGIKALGDESLTFEERFVNATTSIGIGLVQILPSLKTLKQTLISIQNFELPAAWTSSSSLIGKLTGGATTLGAALATIAPIILGIVAALGALYIVFDKLHKASPEYALEQTKKASEDAAKAAKEANKAYSDLKNTLNNFNTKYNAIEEMVVGTYEWQQAVNELNQSILELIENYDLIKDEDYSYRNGIAYITEKGQQKLDKELADRSIRASVTYAQTKVDVKKAEQNVDYKQLDLEFLKIRALNGAVVSGVINDFQEKVKNGVVPSLEELNNAFTNVGVSLSNERLQKLLDKILEVSSSAGKVQESYIQSYGSTAASWMAQNGINVNSELKADYENLASQEIGKIVEDYQNDFNTATDYQSLLQNVRTDTGAQVVYGTKTIESGNNVAETEAFYLEDSQGKRTEISKEDAARYYASYQFTENEDLHQSNFVSKHSSRLQDAQDLQYSHLYKEEELNALDDTYRSDRNAERKIKSELDENLLNKYKKYLEETFEISEKLSEDVAVAHMSFNKGMEDFLDNWDDYKNILQTASKGTVEYVETLEHLRKAMSEILNVDQDDISEEFLTNAENMALMEQAYLGNLSAIEELQKRMAIDLFKNIEDISTETSDQFKSIVEQMDLSNEDLKIGMTLDEAAAQKVYGDYVELLNKLLAAGQITRDEAIKLLSDVNLAGDIEIAEVPFESSWMTMHNVQIPDGQGGYKYADTEEEFETRGSFFIPKLKTENITVISTAAQKANHSIKAKTAGNSSSRQDSMKKADDEIERYHLIKEVIEDVNTELDRLGKQKDRAWGQSHIDLIDQEIEKTQEAIDAQKEYLEQIKGWKEFDQAAIAGFGATFDEMGRITNYEQLMREQIAAYNAAVASGNETRIEAAEERYEKFTKALSKYEETADLFESEYEKLLDLQNQYYDKLLEKVQYKVEVNVQISEEADRYYDYILDRLEDKAYSAAEAIAVLGSKTDESLGRIKAYQEGLNSIFENHGFGEDALQDFLNGKISAKQLAESGFTTEEIETIIQYRNALLEENANLLELRDNIMNQVLETFNKYLDTIDNLIDKFEHLSNVTKSYKNIVDIVGKKALGISNDLIRTMNDVVVENAANSVGAAKDKLESTEKALAELSDTYAEYNEKANDTSLSEAERKYWAEMAEQVKKDMEEVEQSSQEAKEAFLSSWENALTTAREVFEENVQLIMEEFEDVLSGIYGSLDAMKEAYDQNKTLRTQYLEEYERIYELNKLNRDITNSLDTTDSILAKQTLRDLQEEINELQQSGANISKYDLEMLRARYDLRLAEIALEDAENAKSQVRMSRDNDGNWSYVYTADEGTVADAAQNYEDKMMAMQQKSNEYLDQISEQWIATTIEMEQAYQKIYEDRTLSDEERAAAIDRLYAYYGERFQFFTDQINGALENNKILYEEDWMAWADKNNLQIGSNESFQTSFNNTILGITTGVGTIEILHDQLTSAIGGPGEGGFLGALDDAYWAWQKDVDQIMNMAGTSVENFGEDFEKVAKDTQEASDKTAEEVDKMADAMDKSFADASKAARNWANEYATAISEAVLQNETMRGSLGKLLEAISAVTGAYIDLSSVAGLGSNTTFKDLLDKMQAARNGILDDDDNNTPTKKYKYNGKIYDKKEQAMQAVYRDADQLYRQGYRSSIEKAVEELIKNIIEISSYDTGGYTGAWGPNGKLAMLHEKELVLNKEDTENMLKAVEVVRDIMAVTDSQASTSRMGIGAMTARTYAPFDSGMMEQSVTIYADFPNATNHSEIEEAFKDMMNLASQYANRKV